eukprot:9739618-Karenia_brevis.AAC.1
MQTKVEELLVRRWWMTALAVRFIVHMNSVTHREDWLEVVRACRPPNQMRWVDPAGRNWPDWISERLTAEVITHARDKCM